MTRSTPPPEYAQEALNNVVRRLALALGHITPQAKSYHGNVGRLVTEIIAQRDQAQAIVEALKLKVAEQQAEIEQLRVAAGGPAVVAMTEIRSTCEVCRLPVEGINSMGRVWWTHHDRPAARKSHEPVVTPIMMEIEGERVETWPLPPKWSRPDS